MIKGILIGGLCLLLAGCVTGPTQSQLNAAIAKADKASSDCATQAMPIEVRNGWETAKKQSESQCPQAPEGGELSPKEIGETTQCWIELAEEHVSPVTTNKKAFNTYLSNQEKLGARYKAGEINKETAKESSAQIFNEYMFAEISFQKLVQCQNNAYQVHLMPIYHHKHLLADLMIKRLEIGQAVDNGELTQAEGDLALQRAWSDFLGAEQQENIQLQAQRAQAWQNYSERLQQYSQQVTQAEIERERIRQQSAPTHTNCNVFGNSVNCTTQ